MGTLEWKENWDLDFRRLGFECGFCYSEVGDLGKSCYLSLIPSFYKDGHDNTPFNWQADY